LGKQVYKELAVQYPEITSAVIQPAILNSSDKQEPVWIAFIRIKARLSSAESKKIKAFLKTRLNAENILIEYRL
jgi:hypothetical protein